MELLRIAILFILGRKMNMWTVGFKKYLKEVLAAFLGEISCKWSTYNIELILSKQGKDDVVVKLKEGDIEYQEKFSYEDLYNILIPDNSMEYLYLFQDILEEVENIENHSIKDVVVKPYIKDVLQKMLPVIYNRKEQMQTVKEEPIKLVAGVKFTHNGVEYAQLAFV